MKLLEELLNEDNRILIVGAHNDDIELFCGRLILARQGQNIGLLFTATGPIKHWPTRVAHNLYRRTMDTPTVRRLESLMALQHMSLMPSAIKFLPYPELALHEFPNCIDDISKLIDKLNPNYILVQAYEGGHPDHDTTNFYVVLAAQRLGYPIEKVVEYCCYNRYRGQKRVQEFIPVEGTEEMKLIPTPEIQAKWLKAVKKHISQTGIFISIVPHSQSEVFRLTPQHDYLEPPAPIGYTVLRKSFKFFPINIGAFFPASAKLGYDEIKWCVAVNPLTVLEAYKSISKQ